MPPNPPGSPRVTDFLVEHFNLIRGLHILAVIAWMAGMLYLPRLYVYHTGATLGSEMDATFKVMERRLLRGIINPAMIAALVFGLALIMADGAIRGWDFLLKPWMLAKLAGVFFLFGWHGFLSKARKAFEAGQNTRSEKFWRATNELPFVAAIVIVLSVTTKYLN
ncbi:CopD family protein [Caulobacter sp. CCNWLY153]|uniref:CopD family protein n=1 Tax=Caulobacter TaxID=75 RepID=UPI00243600D7|nr:CopD family protein [Caulobacter radicis]